MTNVEKKINLLKFSRKALREWFDKELKQPAFRADQVWQWIWQKLILNFEDMTNVSKNLRSLLAEKSVIVVPEIHDRKTSSDGTTKLLLRLEDGALIETVLIPAPNRNGEIRWSQCLSSQVGCAMGCVFCATGKMGFTRNMTVSEILGQVLIGKKFLNDRHSDKPILRNLVFMGMGEPLLNTYNVLTSLECLNDQIGANFSPRRITISTCGIENGLHKLGENGLAWLAISLHAPTQEVRQTLMPTASRWSLEDMITSLEKYPLKTRERITFEYLLIGGVNDSIEHAKALVKILSHIKAKINLIVYNPVPGLPFTRPAPETVEAFQKFLCSKNITAILRKSRGADIAAACGQLATNFPAKQLG